MRYGLDTKFRLALKEYMQSPRKKVALIEQQAGTFYAQQSFPAQ
jgi:hypothetical protein